MKLAISVLAVGSAFLGSTFADSVYVNPIGDGNQNYTGGLRMDFDLSRSITVTSLGAFDSAQDGFVGSITVDLYRRSGTPAILASQTFTGTLGTLIDGSRFLTLLTPLILPSGFQGSIVAHGYSASDLNGNVGCNSGACGVNSVDANPTTNSLGSAITFVGGSYYSGATGLPPTADTGPANRYEAGTFEAALTPTPEPASFLLLGLGLGALAMLGRNGLSRSN